MRFEHDDVVQVTASRTSTNMTWLRYGSRAEVGRKWSAKLTGIGRRLDAEEVDERGVIIGPSLRVVRMVAVAVTVIGHGRHRRHLDGTTFVIDLHFADVTADGVDVGRKRRNGC